MDQNIIEKVTKELESLLALNVKYGELSIRLSLHDGQIRYIRSSVENQIKVEA